MLESIKSPADLRGLSYEQLTELSAEIRQFLITKVSKTGGHLSSNLGTDELTVALHYVFQTPYDRLIWDVGHQSYPHKILTGRRERMPTLRQLGGLSGFPRRDESEYDNFGTAHSSTSISAAFGMAMAAKQTRSHRKSVAIIGDGALTAGMAFEALNNAGNADADLLVILNDNDMSISQPVGALNQYLGQLMSGRFYAEAKKFGQQVLRNAPPLFELARRIEQQTQQLIQRSLFLSVICDASTDIANLTQLVVLYRIVLPDGRVMVVFGSIEEMPFGEDASAVVAAKTRVTRLLLKMISTSAVRKRSRHDGDAGPKL